jgi:hypothetical protein
MKNITGLVSKCSGTNSIDVTNFKNNKHTTKFMNAINTTLPMQNGYSQILELCGH